MSLRNAFQGFDLIQFNTSKPSFAASRIRIMPETSETIRIDLALLRRRLPKEASVANPKNQMVENDEAPALK